MLLLLLGCSEAPPPAAPLPTIPGLSAAAPEPADIIDLSATPHPRLTYYGTDDLTVLTTEGALLSWRPDTAPITIADDVVDLTHDTHGLLGLTQDGTIVLPSERLETGSSGDGLLIADQDSALIAVLQDGLRVIDTDTQEVLWTAEVSPMMAIAIGGGLIFDFDTSTLVLTARDARSGEIQTQRTIRPPHRTQARGSRPRKSIGELAPKARAASTGTPRMLQELRAALHYDPTTDRLFFRQLVLDGRTLEPLGRIPDIDGVLYADQGRIVGRRRGWDGTISIMDINPVRLTVEGRVPLLRPEGEPHIFYDPESDTLTLSEPGRDRLLRWNSPLTSP
ncbi:MAG: hypothetical protein P8R54_29795 [Myxococcota bacterium]|nr:hypothetical protein [Myxococcota bacterium]